MAVISKNGEVAKIIKKISKETFADCVSISKNKIAIKAADNKFTAYLTLEEEISSLSSTKSISSEMFLVSLSYYLEENDFNPVFEDDKIRFGEYSFTCSSGSDNMRFPTNKKFFSLKKEDMGKNFKDDFFITADNIFKNAKMVETSVIFIKEGTVYKAAPSSSLYKISELICEKDQVAIDQNFGHSTVSFTIPKNIISIFEDVNYDSVDFMDIDTEEEIIYIGNNIFTIKYHYYAPKFNLFNKNLELSKTATYDKDFYLSEATTKSLDMFKNWPKNSEDIFVKLSNKDGNTVLSLDGVEIKFDGESSELGMNASVLTWFSTMKGLKYSKVSLNGEGINNRYFIKNTDGDIFIAIAN